MDPSLGSLFDSLDGATYFFVSSGIFVFATAAIFFGAGLWTGMALWGRYRRRFEAARDEIEQARNELALLKRRAAEPSTRPVTPSLQAGTAPSNPALAALVRPASDPDGAFPPSGAFTVWTTSD